mmetsp:Transcript_25129/g.28965  ORF Transcript_25129/g.28965 Transcript_25129/m.28965 type:complete len:550 (+) Transcript_25129:152-1801(+)
MATDNKYDRQLRLWGANGQKALSLSNIVLLNATSAGTETLKNLVLPGIGSFHVYDSSAVTETDVTSNFFVTSDDVGKSRAEVTCKLLSELNSDVTGGFTHADSEGFVNFLRAQSSRSALVIVSDVPLSQLQDISTFCHQESIPLISVKSYGLIGIVRLQNGKTPHTIIESKPDNSVPDLRLANPFDELNELVDKFELEKLDDKDHSHVPYVILLIKAINLYKETSDNRHPPRTHDQKSKFKNLVKSMSRNFDMEVNFEDAVKESYLAYTSKEIPYEVQEIMDNTSDNDVSANSFDVMVKALKRFIENNGGLPPLHGGIPDMTSSTEYYVALQDVYKKKSEKDLMVMKRYVNEISNGTDITVPSEELVTFCKNIGNIFVQSHRSISRELEQQLCPENNNSLQVDDEIIDDLVMSCMDPSSPASQTPLLWYLGVRAGEIYQRQHGCFPGSQTNATSKMIESDSKKVQSILVKLVTNMKLNSEDLIQTCIVASNDIASEIVRFGNCEIHNISSVVGGVASQEAVKLLTKQYTLLDNTYIYNGIASIGGVYKF